ncbi:MAG: alcohol dehydrogenase catalytic domain-containing protein [Spirochaetes bacterium]|nr:alcohol dehydrogenase catalytic domain-containing protein [Spirochaetota bacterium]
MIQVFLDGPRSIAMVERPIPKPESRQVLVRIHATGICATDVHSYYGETIHGNHFPFHIGHEISGTVVETGGEVSRVKIGDKVVIDPLVTCDRCENCLSGHSNRCTAIRPLGIHGPGGFSEYTVIDERNTFPFEKPSFEEMTFAEPLSTVLNGIATARAAPGMNILVQGAGTLGLLYQQALTNSTGCKQVTIGDISEERLSVARTLKAKVILMPIAGYVPTYDLVIDCTGNRHAVSGAISLLKDGGTLLIFGVCGHDDRIEVSPFDIYRRELKIIGTFSLNKNMKDAVSLLESGKVNARPLIGGVVLPSMLEKTIVNLHEKKISGRYIVKREV